MNAEPRTHADDSTANRHSAYRRASAADVAVEMNRDICMVAVAGAASGSARTTAAVNLAVALAVSGLDVRLCDLDPAGSARRALGSAPAETSGSTPLEVRLSRELRGRVTVTDGMDHVDAAGGRTALAGAPGEGMPDVLVVHCPPVLDDAALAAVRRAGVVLVPVDASPGALAALESVAAAIGAPGAPAASGGVGPRIRAAMVRVLPRAVDRWAVVDRITERYPDALYATTIPMGRRASSGGEPPTLYAPTTRAAAAYAALAREVRSDLAL
jgi:chromosome partitioning protein